MPSQKLGSPVLPELLKDAVPGWTHGQLVQLFGDAVPLSSDLTVLRCENRHHSDGCALYEMRRFCLATCKIVFKILVS